MIIIKESLKNLKINVTWPTWTEAQSLTVIVADFSIVFSWLFGELILYFQWC